MQNSEKYAASCHCGEVKITLGQRPKYINACNCSLCRKCGGVWGYFNPSEVRVLGATQSYQRSDLPTPALKVHFCPSCGSTTHWTLAESPKLRTGGSSRIGVNMRLFDGAQLAGIELRFPDGKTWNDESELVYCREAITLGKDDVL